MEKGRRFRQLAADARIRERFLRFDDGFPFGQKNEDRSVASEDECAIVLQRMELGIFLQWFDLK
jgi:hypothetical protein